MINLERNSGNEVVVELTERHWLSRHSRGDKQAFKDLLRAYQNSVYTYLARTGLAPEVRDDLFQEIFLKIHRAAHSYDPSKPLRPWIFTIAINTVRNYHRGAGPRDTLAGADDITQVPDLSPGPLTQLDATKTLKWLQAQIGMLPRIQREILILNTIEGLSQQTIAEMVGLPVNTVKSQLRRTRIKLARALAAREAGAGGTP